MHKGQEKRATGVDIRDATVFRVTRLKITVTYLICISNPITVFESIKGG